MSGTNTAPEAAAPAAAPAPAPEAPAQAAAPVSPAAQRDGLTVGQVASARAFWISLGKDPAIFDAEYGGPAFGVAGGNVEQGQADMQVSPVASLTPEQADKMAAELAARGMSDEQVAAEMDRFGMQPDPRSDEQRAWDNEHGMDRAYAPSDYRVRWTDTGLAQSKSTAELVAIQGQWGSFLSAMQVPPAIGAGWIEHAVSVNASVRAMAPADQANWVRNKARRY